MPTVLRHLCAALLASAFLLPPPRACAGMPALPDDAPIGATAAAPPPNVPAAPSSAAAGYRSLHFRFSLNTTGGRYMAADGNRLFVSDFVTVGVHEYAIDTVGAVFQRTYGSGGGSSPGQFQDPRQMTVIGNDLLVADAYNHRVQRFNRTTGAYINQFGSNGTGAGQFNEPTGLVYNPVNGQLYVSDASNRVQRFTAAGAYLGQFGSTGTGDGQFAQANYLAVDSFGNVYVADKGSNQRVEKFDANGVFIRHIAAGLPVQAVAIDRANGLWISTDVGIVIAVDARGNQTGLYDGGYGNPNDHYPGLLGAMQGIAVTAPLSVAPYHGAAVVAVQDNNPSRIQLYTRALQPLTHPQLDAITGLGGYNGQIAYDSAENIYVTSFNANRVYKFDKFGAVITNWGGTGTGNGQFSGALGITIDFGDNVYVADRNNNRIQKFDAAGNYLMQWGTLGSGNGQLNHPSHLATDGALVYVTEELNRRVQVFTNAGIYQRKWGTLGSGNGQFSTPIGIAFDYNRSQVYVADYDQGRIQQFTAGGDFMQVLSGTLGIGALLHPLGLATDQHGNLYCADSGNARVVHLDGNGAYLTAFASSGANGIGANWRNGQLHVGTIGGSVVTRYASVVGKAQTIGVYRPSTQTFKLRDSNTAGPPTITSTVAGADANDLAITGDWNGDGIDTPGLFRPSTATFYLWDRWYGLSMATPDYTLPFGSTGDQPIVGDWDADGRSSVGVLRPSTGAFLLHNAPNGAGDYSLYYGFHGDLGVAGDWNGDGAFSAGVFRASDLRFHVINSNASGVFIADDGAYVLGNATDLPVVGDWAHTGSTGIGVFRRATGTFYLKTMLDASPADLAVQIDGDVVFHDGFEVASGDVPLSGVWGATAE